MSFISTIRKSKLAFYITNSIQLAIPKFIFQRRKNYWLQQAKKYPKETISNRLDYCLSLKKGELNKEAILLKNFKRPKKDTMYFYDLAKYTKYFKNSFKIHHNFGDIEDNQETLTIVKSRPIDHTGNSVLMKLNAHRHFNFVQDSRAYADKKDTIVWRGIIHKENRRYLVEQFYQHPKCDIGHIKLHKGKPEWQKPFLTLDQQLENKFILSIEGNDVATNLKWVLSSNSLCFMPTPKFETWFMEGKLVPNVHYVHIKEDYSDMLEKMDYYANNEEAALKIIKNANDWVAQFKDKKLEKILSLLILDNYFSATEQQ